MNKLTLIVLFIACVISAHAFVKRDAPAEASPNYLQDIQSQFANVFNQINATLSKTLDPEKIKKDFSDLVDNIKNLKPKDNA